MQARLNLAKSAPAAYKAMLQLEAFIKGCGLEHSLLHLAKIRASQVNGCAFCVNMHYKQAREAGESEERLSLLSVWRESPVFTARERAALAWAEAVTLIATAGISDELFEATRKHFKEEELINLTLAVNTINSWNRLMIALAVPPAVNGRKAAE